MANKKCAVCNRTLKKQDGGVVQCPDCFTKTNLRNDKIDIAETVVNPTSCTHPQRTLLRSTAQRALRDVGAVHGRDMRLLRTLLGTWGC